MTAAVICNLLKMLICNEKILVSYPHELSALMSLKLRIAHSSKILKPEVRGKRSAKKTCTLR